MSAILPFARIWRARCLQTYFPGNVQKWAICLTSKRLRSFFSPAVLPHLIQRPLWVLKASIQLRQSEWQSHGSPPAQAVRETAGKMCYGLWKVSEGVKWTVLQGYMAAGLRQLCRVACCETCESGEHFFFFFLHFKAITPGHLLLTAWCAINICISRKRD